MGLDLWRVAERWRYLIISSLALRHLLLILKLNVSKWQTEQTPSPFQQGPTRIGSKPYPVPSNFPLALKQFVTAARGGGFSPRMIWTNNVLPLLEL